MNGNRPYSTKFCIQNSNSGLCGLQGIPRRKITPLSDTKVTQFDVTKPQCDEQQQCKMFDTVEKQATKKPEKNITNIEQMQRTCWKYLKLKCH